MYCAASCAYSARLIKKLKSLDIENKLDFLLIDKAIYWVKKYHGPQLRNSGEPFYSHPLEVAYIISDYNLKTDVIVSSILHDIIEDTEVTAGMILDVFGWRIAKMVYMLTRDRPDGSKLSIEEILNNAYQEKDIEVLLIKLIDRLHNMQTIQFKSQEAKERIALETWNMFLVANASINAEFEKELNFYIYQVLPLPPEINSAEQLYMLSDLKEQSVLPPLTF